MEAEGLSRDLGIEPGFIFRSIDGAPVKPNFEEFFADFLRAMEQLPFHYEVELEFATQSGTRKTVRLRQRPIEMMFAASLPIVISSTQGHSEDLGIRAGWQLKRFARRNVDDCATFEEFCDAFKAALAPLHKTDTASRSTSRATRL
jgi:hypothetical protein